MLRRAALCLLLLSLSGCATTRGGAALYRKDIGTASGADAMTLAQRVVHRYQYEVETVDSIPEIRLTTFWKKRAPFDDEVAVGVHAAESRIVITARQRGQTELGTFFNITMYVENRVQVAGTSDWNEMLNTDMFKQYADEMTNEYRQLVTNIGVRRY